MSKSYNETKTSPQEQGLPEPDYQLAGDHNAGGSSNFCTCKALAKFVLIYFISIVFAVLCFVAIYRECQTEEQDTWWWIFIASLIFSFSAFVLSLTIIVYSDYYQPEESYQDIEQSPNLSVNDSVQKDPQLAAPEGSNSASIKSVNTILSHPVSQSARPPSGADNFVNYTPGAGKSPVTVMDMHNARKRLEKKVVKHKKKNKQKDADNYGFSVIPTSDYLDTLRKKKKKHKAHKVKT